MESEWNCSEDCSEGGMKVVFRKRAEGVRYFAKGLDGKASANSSACPEDLSGRFMCAGTPVLESRRGYCRAHAAAA